MTALVGGTVEQTLSASRREKTGLSGAKTHEADRKDFGDLIQPFAGVVWAGE
jgi:hypothetical protein